MPRYESESFSNWSRYRFCTTYGAARSRALSKRWSDETGSAGLDAGCPLALKCHFHLSAVFIRDFEHLAGLHAQEASHKDLRDLADAGVVGVDVVVEELAPVGDAFLQFCDPVLQLEKIFIGLELRIVLGHGKQAAQSAGHQQVGARLLPDAGRVHGS